MKNFYEKNYPEIINKIGLIKSWVNNIIKLQFFYFHLFVSLFQNNHLKHLQYKFLIS